MKVTFDLGFPVDVKVRWDYVSEFTTTCTVNTESGLLVGHGAASRSISDWPDRTKAEKVSLGRAIQHLPKEIRAIFWSFFWEREARQW